MAARGIRRIAAALLLAWSAASAAQSEATRVVETVNARDVGSTGWRRVRIDIINDRTVVRAFIVVNVWRRSGGEVRTLFHLEQPPGLAGTSYLEIERTAAASAFEVFLSLPTSRGRVLTIAPENLGDGLLGADFAYSDLRMLLPVGAKYRFVGRTRMLGRAAVILEATPNADAQLPWTRARFFVDSSIGFVLGADTASGPQVKRMRVDKLACRDGVWTAEQMTMISAPGRSTRITLLAAAFHIDGAAPALFDERELAQAGKRIASLDAPLQRQGGAGR
jgi:hypothetical protein